MNKAILDPATRQKTLAAIGINKLQACDIELKIQYGQCQNTIMQSSAVYLDLFANKSIFFAADLTGFLFSYFKA